MKSDIRILNIEPTFEDCIARTPLKFGAVVVDRVCFARVKVTVENGAGQVATGWGGIFIMDFWGWPTKDLSHEVKEAAMQEVVRRYVALALGYDKPAHPVDIFMDLESDLARINREVCAERGLTPEQPFLGALVCASPIDAALHDAFGNVNGIDSYCGYGPEHMPSLDKWLGPQFTGKYAQDYIRPAYLPRVPIFHLVGGLDKLYECEVDDTDAQDGLPNSLEAWIRRDGMYCLKVKLRGTDLDWDIARTIAVHDIGWTELQKLGCDTMHLTADTNEQCDSPEYIIEMLRKIREQRPECYDRILYIEQPTERDLTAHRHDMRELSKLKPVIVDESLTDIPSFDLALELGWSGVALKTCKGHSSDLLFASKARQLGIPYAIQDLTNPSLALFHSVGLAARLYPIMGVEANSRQFFPAATPEQEQLAHPGIYRIQGGEADTTTLRGTGLGYAGAV